LLGGSVECVALLVGNGEFHDGGSTHIHVFRGYPTVLTDTGIGRSQCGGCVVPCRFLPRPTRSLRSLLEVGGSTSKILIGRDADTAVASDTYLPYRRPNDRIF